MAATDLTALACLLEGIDGAKIDAWQAESPCAAGVPAHRASWSTQCPSASTHGSRYPVMELSESNAGVTRACPVRPSQIASIQAVEDHIGSLLLWPYAEQQLLSDAQPLRRGPCYRLILFLLGNGAPPVAVARLLLDLRLLPSQL